MKNLFNYKYAAIAAILLGILTSCDKYLNLSPPSGFDEKYVFSTVEGATSAVIGAYERLSFASGYGSRLTLMYPFDTDDFIGVTSGAGAPPDNNTRDISRYNVQPTNAQLAPCFLQMYAGIERANICIKNIPSMELYNSGSETVQKQLRRLYGEALTLRAQFFFDLVKIWGDVPAPFEPSIDQPDLFLPQIDRDLIYDRILDDLLLAEELVPWRKDPIMSVDERMSKGTVKGLRARIALFRGGYALRRESGIMERSPDYLEYYQIARDECFEIMQHRDQHTLNPSFQSVFKDNIDAYKIEPNGEVMFEVAFGRDLTSGTIGYYDGPRFNVPGISSTLGNGSVRGVPVYFYAFDSLDTRRDVTLAPYWTNADKTKTVQTMVNMTNGKFRADWWDPAPNSASQQTGINFPILRFSDILLMFAEAENELNQGPTAAGKAAFEEVRRRAFRGNENAIGITPSDYTGFFKSIVNERYFEFGAECIRKYDLIRWNLLASKLEETRNNYRKMLMREAPYDTLPLQMDYKTGSTTVVWGNSLYKPTPVAVPAGYVRVSWLSSISTTWVDNFAIYFKPNRGEIFPLPQAVVETNPNLKQSYGY